MPDRSLASSTHHARIDTDPLPEGVVAKVEVYDRRTDLFVEEHLHHGDAVEAFIQARELHKEVQSYDPGDPNRYDVFVTGSSGAVVRIEDNGWTRVGF